MSLSPEAQEALVGAVRYALRRVQTDAEFAWHMMHTETFERLCAAEALVSGKAVDSVRDEYSKDLRPAHRQHESARCEVDRQFRSELAQEGQKLLSDFGDEYPARFEGLRELLDSDFSDEEILEKRGAL